MVSVARVAPLALTIERYGLSGFFLFLAWAEATQVREFYVGLQVEGAPPGIFADLVKHVLVFFLDLLVGLLLLLSKRPVGLPQQWKDLLVPLVANFFYPAYGLTAQLPAPYSSSLWPETWRTAVAHVALYLGLTGLAFAIWAMVHIGRSFAVLVTVKKVVMNGPYRLVRHPIYLGYLFQITGLVCAYGSPAILVVAVGHWILLVYRARLEEAQLAAASAEYRAYQERTPFILPRLLPGR